jgi:hypothetical protein
MNVHRHVELTSANRPFCKQLVMTPAVQIVRLILRAGEVAEHSRRLNSPRCRSFKHLI